MRSDTFQNESRCTPSQLQPHAVLSVGTENHHSRYWRSHSCLTWIKAVRTGLGIQAALSVTVVLIPSMDRAADDCLLLTWLTDSSSMSLIDAERKEGSSSMYIIRDEQGYLAFTGGPDTVLRGIPLSSVIDTHVFTVISDAIVLQRQAARLMKKYWFCFSLEIR